MAKLPQDEPTRKQAAVAEAYRGGYSFGPNGRCVCCGQMNDDRDEIDRGICSACWQVVDALQSGAKQ